jgi:hypothetical protein
MNKTNNSQEYETDNYECNLKTIRMGKYGEMWITGNMSTYNKN